MQRRHFMAPSGGALLAGAVGSAFAKPASDITAYFVPGGQFGLNPWFLNNGTDRLTPDGRREQRPRPAFPRDAGVPPLDDLRAQGVAHIRAQ